MSYIEPDPNDHFWLFIIVVTIALWVISLGV